VATGHTGNSGDTDSRFLHLSVLLLIKAGKQHSCCKN